MKPRLRGDVRFRPADDGVFLRSEAGVFTLPGKQTCLWLERIAPFLTGAHELADLTAALPDEHRDVVTRLVGVLYDQGLVVDADADKPHTLTPDELATYAEHIAFIAYALDSPEHRFQRFRETPVALLGDGPIAEEIRRAGLEAGWREIGTEVTDNALLIQVSADPDAFVPHNLAVRVFVEPNAVWLSPVGRPGAGHEGSLHGPQVHEGSPHGLLTGPVPAVVAAQVVLACFLHLTGLDELGEPALTRIDLRTLDTTTHP
ncbi:hypothetical protein Lesp02_35250 [Lentzea sp. NBRC 105346]|uniref:hypothetical protein n=1 Tax=Lentzea sp. NBRC 105346 TaxID=3032205 RepID=UPI0024A01BC4|nr:hypothetical protein [Lentzea sp. NBRC 105346]GLZ31337.1 hypothetical protein Lesp02_35250 [Lentzea sp. NBRC 105346]